MADEQQRQTFPPAAEFTAQANISDPNVYDEAAADPEGWWQIVWTGTSQMDGATKRRLSLRVSRAIRAF